VGRHLKTRRMRAGLSAGMSLSASLSARSMMERKTGGRGVGSSSGGDHGEGELVSVLDGVHVYHDGAYVYRDGVYVYRGVRHDHPRFLHGE
jgi:hypothetical protein